MLFLLSCVALAAPHDRVGRDFAEAVSTASSDRCSYEPDEAAVACENGGTTYLHDFFIQWDAAADPERAALMQRWVRLAAEPHQGPDSADDLRKRLRPALKARAESASMKLYAQVNDSTFDGASVGLTDSLVVQLVVDSPEAMRLASHADLATLGLEPAEALALAITNLGAHAEFTFTPAGEGVYTAQVGDAYDAARFLLDEPVGELQLKGDPVVLAGGRELLFITGTEEPALLDVLRIAGQMGADPNIVKPISVVPFVRLGDGWTDLVLPPDHPGAPTLASLKILQRGQWYAGQRELLERLFAGRGEAVAVEKLGYVGPSGLGFSITTLQDGTVLLPEAEYVGVMQGEALYLIGWTDFVTVAGGALTVEAGTYPPLYRADGASLYADLARFSTVWQPLDDVMVSIGAARSP